jgi:hypothetical protein
MRFTPLIALTAVAAIAAATPAAARTESFRATLDGTAIPTTTGSPAHGRVTVKVDTKTQRVSVELDVQGITLDQLNDALVAKPIGPVHFHQYRTADDVEAVLPVPYGANYRATKNGFHVSMRNYAYAEGAKLLNDQDKFPDGEISGKVMPN